MSSSGNRRNIVINKNSSKLTKRTLDSEGKFRNKSNKMQLDESEGEMGDNSVFAQKPNRDAIPKFQNSVFDMVQTNSLVKKK